MNARTEGRKMIQGKLSCQCWGWIYFSVLSNVCVQQYQELTNDVTGCGRMQCVFG